MRALHVLDPGLLATLQDLGRPGHAALGVARSGAADPLSLRIANRLVGNRDDAAALELTLTGGAWRAEGDLRVALGGAPMPLSLEVEGAPPRALATWRAHDVPTGSVLRLGATRRGARAYLAVAGGFAVAATLGSVATHPASGLGGTSGQALRRGERLPIASRPRGASARALSTLQASQVEGWLAAGHVCATDGSHAPLFDAATRQAFWAGTFAATEQADRMGVRLVGPLGPPPADGSLRTEGLPVGAVEVPAEGTAIALLCDAPPTGGYPVIAAVAAVDLPRLGQWRPREALRFQRVELEEARAAYRERERWLDAALPPA